MEQLETPDGNDDPGRRGNLRADLGIPGKLILLDGNGRCAVENISREGACILTREPLAAGAHGVLQCDGLDHFFTVHWEESGRCGISFDEVVPKEIILRLRHLASSREDGVDATAWEFGREWVAGDAGHLTD